ncbi:MAG: hypoxanthine phosphoribosyltransferase [Anaerolineae bacterium]|nr:hypoxanthine phosphoribosyltransferase [Anaerolineae bacterium]
MHDYQHFLQEILIDQQQLATRVAELAAVLDRDYAGIKGLTLVCILKGGIMFLTDLMRHLTVPHAVEFMAASSYGVEARESTGHVKIGLDIPSERIRGKHVLIVEDIIDSGTTLAYVRQMLLDRQPASLKICTLLNKPERRETPVPVDYIGFEIPNKFVFGYGLDLDELYRNLPFIGVVNPGAILTRE